MAFKDFQTNDLVWAKMKGYPLWPGKIVVPPAGKKNFKNGHYVQFFETKQRAFIEKEFIQMHDATLVAKFEKRKGRSFKKAVEAIVRLSRDTPTENVVKAAQIESFSQVADSHPPSKPKKMRHSDEGTSKVNSSAELHVTDAHPSNYGGFAEETVTLEEPAGLFEDFKNYIRKKIGVLGLDKVGQSIVRSLPLSCHIIVWSEEPSERAIFDEMRNIEVASTPADVVKAADIIFFCASDADVTQELIFGDCSILNEFEHSKPRKGFFEMTPLDPKVAQLIGSEIKIRGGYYLEAAVCGSRNEVSAGNLLIVAAGDKKLYDDCEMYMDAISKKHIFVSAEVGAASKLSVIYNLLHFTVFAASSEAYTMAEEFGLKGEDFFAFLGDVYGENILFKMMISITQNGADLVKQIQHHFNIGLPFARKMSRNTALFAIANESVKNM